MWGENWRSTDLIECRCGGFERTGRRELGDHALRLGCFHCRLVDIHLYLCRGECGHHLHRHHSAFTTSYFLLTPCPSSPLRIPLCALNSLHLLLCFSLGKELLLHSLSLLLFLLHLLHARSVERRLYVLLSEPATLGELSMHHVWGDGGHHLGRNKER